MPSFTPSLEQAIHDAVAIANEHKHESATLEHLLLALLSEPDARLVLQACNVSITELGETLKLFIEAELSDLISEVEGSKAGPTAAFGRVVQRAAIHVQASGRAEVTGANVLLAIFSERESSAAYFLTEQGITRYDAVNFMSHGVAKNSDFQAELDEPLIEPEIQTKKPITVTPPALVFVSYASQDRDKVRGYVEMLRSQRLNCWWDQDIPKGAFWREQIEENLANSAAVLTFWTQNSVQSKPVIEEAATAQSGRKLVHVRLDDAALPYGFSETQYADLRRPDTARYDSELTRLITALNDRLHPPKLETMRERVVHSGAVGVGTKDGKLTLVDAPEGHKPLTVNPADLEARLSGAQQSTGTMVKMIADRDTYQLPETLHHCLAGIAEALQNNPATWYAIQDSKLLLCDCMEDHFAKDSWNDTVYKGLCQIVKRIDEMREFLQPKQGSVDDPDPQTTPTPVVRADQIEDVGKIAQMISAQIFSVEMADVVDDTIGNAVKTAVSQIDAGLDKPKLYRVRRSVVRLAQIAGGIIATVGVGVGTAVLTSADASITLATRLQPLFDMLMKFF